jgi:hypothetical protein
MKITSNYRLKYGQSFISSIMFFFVGLFFSFVIALLYSKIIGWILFGGILAYLWYWNSKKDGQFSILFQKEEKQLEMLGKVELNEAIKKIYIGWSYAYHNPMQGLKGQNSHFFMPMNRNKNDERTMQNTFQKIIILQLKNGQNVALIKELLPWQETGDLYYIGQIAETITLNHELYIKGSFSDIQEKL